MTHDVTQGPSIRALLTEKNTFQPNPNGLCEKQIRKAMKEKGVGYILFSRPTNTEEPSEKLKLAIFSSSQLTTEQVFLARPANPAQNFEVLDRQKIKSTRTAMTTTTTMTTTATTTMTTTTTTTTTMIMTMTTTTTVHIA